VFRRLMRTWVENTWLISCVVWSGAWSDLVHGCRQLGIRGFDQLASDPNGIAALLSEAWDRFLADPDAFGAWEQSRSAALWNELGC
jgi:hypothetical protein